MHLIYQKRSHLCRRGPTCSRITQGIEVARKAHHTSHIIGLSNHRCPPDQPELVLETGFAFVSTSLATAKMTPSTLPQNSPLHILTMVKLDLLYPRPALLILLQRTPDSSWILLLPSLVRVVGAVAMALIAVCRGPLSLCTSQPWVALAGGGTQRLWALKGEAPRPC